MPKTMTTIRLNDLTRQQLDELTERYSMTQTDVIQYAIDRMYHQERTHKMSNNQNPTFEIRHFDGDVDVAVVTYPDGSMFTLGDWQGPQPADESQITHWDTWVKVNPAEPDNIDYWQPAILLDGWPRVIE